jgi:hypothetical protein
MLMREHAAEVLGGAQNPHARAGSSEMFRCDRE